MVMHIHLLKLLKLNKLVHLRNPWDIDEWSCDWSDSNKNGQLILKNN